MKLCSCQYLTLILDAVTEIEMALRLQFAKNLDLLRDKFIEVKENLASLNPKKNIRSYTETSV